MRRTSSWTRAGLLMLVWGLTGPVQAGTVVYDFVADYSTTVGNPNGVWKYGYEASNGGALVLYTAHSSNAWLGNIGGDGTPAIWKNDTSSPAFGVAPGQVSLHPGPQNQPSIARWTAPSGIASSIQIDGQFFAGDSGSMQVGIFKNNNWASPLFQVTDHGSFSLTQTVAAGDTIDFAVYAWYAYGNTPLSARITATTAPTAVPEPSTLISAAMAGLFGLACAWRRRPRLF